MDSCGSQTSHDKPGGRPFEFTIQSRTASTWSEGTSFISSVSSLDSSLSPTSNSSSQLKRMQVLLVLSVTVLLAVPVFCGLTGYRLEVRPSSTSASNARASSIHLETLALQPLIEATTRNNETIAKEAIQIGKKPPMPTYRESSKVNNDTRPILVLHIGPHKTATSTTQCQLTYYQNILRQRENFTYLGRQYIECQDRHSSDQHQKDLSTRDLVRCLDHHTNERPCDQTAQWKNFEKTLEELASQNQNVVISDEAFSRIQLANNDGKLILLFRTIHPHFRLKVVIVYRHYFSWMLSQYNEHFKPLPTRDFFLKWPGEGNGKRIQPFTTYYEEHQRQVQTGSYQSAAAKGNYMLAADRLGLHPVAYLQQQWMDPTILHAPKEVLVVDMHQDEDVVGHFLQQALSPQVALELQQYKKREAAKGKNGAPGRKNKSFSSNLDFDMLAVQARERGLVPKHDKLPRRPVARFIEDKFYQSTIFQTNTVPRLCLNATQTQQFWNRSLFLAQTVFSDAEDRPRRKQHRSEFGKANLRHDFCNLDTENLLENESVQKLFRSLQGILKQMPPT